jgi:hypothetical protein
VTHQPLPSMSLIGVGRRGGLLDVAELMKCNTSYLCGTLPGTVVPPEPEHPVPSVRNPLKINGRARVVFVVKFSIARSYRWLHLQFNCFLVDSTVIELISDPRLTRIFPPKRNT